MNYARRLDRRAASRKARRLAVKDQIRRGLMAERLEDRSLMAGDVVSSFLASSHSAYWNPATPTDVNADGSVAPNDALAIINAINSQGSHKLPEVAGEGETNKLYLDVNDDGYLAPNDALAVINALNGEGQGPPKIQYTFKAVPSGTTDAVAATGLTTVSANQAYDLVLIAKDLRPNGTFTVPDPDNPGQFLTQPLVRGVFAAYTDILYDKNFSKVNLAEIQTLAFTGTTTGSFTLTFNGQTTGTINFDNTSAAARVTTATSIQTALNTLLGTQSNPTPISVTNTPATSNNYRVRFVGFPTIDEPLLQAGNISTGTNINVTETLTGNPNNSAAFLSQVVFNNNITFQTGTDQNTGDPIFSTFAYSSGQSGGNAADRIDDVGAVSSSTGSAGLTTAPWEVFRIHMIAQLPSGQDTGTEVFTPSLGITDPVLNPAPNGLIRPDHNPLVYGNNAASPPEVSDVADDEIISNTLTLSITSGPINAADDTLSFAEDTAAGATTTVNVLANDTKNPGAPAGALQVVSFTQPATGGSVAYQNPADHTNGNLVFTPTANFSGTATFTYTVGIVGDNTVTDQKTQTVTVTVSPVNDAPTINVPSAQSTGEDAAKSIGGITVADVDADASGGVQLTLNVGHGSLHATSSGAAVLSGNDTGALTITGLVADVNASVATLSYTPSLDFSGSDNLTATVNDQGHTGTGGPLSASKSVAISISAVNDPPAISGPSAQAVVFVQTLTFSSANSNAITITDPDAGTDPIKVTLAVAGGVGTLHVTAANGVTVTGNDSTSLSLTGPQAGINATLNGMVLTPPQTVQTGSITIDSDDQGHNPAPAKTDHKVISIQTAPPVLPFAVNDTASFAEGTTGGQTINVLSNDLLNTGATATITGVTQPGSGLGSVAISGSTLVYTLPSDPDFFTPVNPITFTYTMNDDGTGSQPSTATVSVTITNVADTPVAVNDSYGTAIGVALTRTAAQGVLANDTDIDNTFGKPDVAVLTVLNGSVTQPAHGSVTVAADGSFTYTPNSGFGGDDTFTYRAHSSLGPDSAPATVSIHVAAPPQAVDDKYTTAQEDQAFTSPTSVLANDSDPTEHQALTAALVTNVPASAGSVTLNADGTFTYNPAPNFNTTRPATPDISFTYKASAGGRDSNVATVTLKVNEVNDNPTASNVTFLGVKNNGTIGIDQPITVPLTGIAPDVDETLKVTVINGVTSATADASGNAGPVATSGGGSVRLSNFQILYTSPSTTGAGSFTYQLGDFDKTSGAARGGTSAPATVNVTIVDFVPKTVSGTVYLDGNNDGNADSGEKRLDGVVVTLTGTDFTNQAVTLTATTDLNGSYSFIGLKPPKVGTTYTLTEIQPVYLLSGLDTNAGSGASAALVADINRLDDLFALSWAVTDQSGNIGNLNFGERGIDVASLSNSSGLIQEFFASSGSNGFVLAVDGSGNLMWNWTLPGWDNAKSIHLSLDSSLASLTLSVIDGQNHTYSATLTQGYSLPGSTARFRILGVGQNGQYIIRIDGSANGATDGMGMNLLAATSGGSGEGEASGSQYVNSADAVFATEAWA